MRERYGRLDGRRGQRRRDDFLAAHPFCKACWKRGVPTLAEEVDHVKALHKGGAEAPDNLQALCGPCHRAKTRRERSAAPAPEWRELINEVASFLQPQTP